jgi:hypothetical protein
MDHMEHRLNLTTDIYITSFNILMLYPEIKIDSVNVWAGPTTPQVAKAGLNTLSFFKNERFRLREPRVIQVCFYLYLLFQLLKHSSNFDSSYERYGIDP